MDYRLSTIAVLVSIRLLTGCTYDRGTRETQFSIPHPDQIAKINIFSSEFSNQTMFKKGDRWWLNDSTKIRPDAINNMMRILPFMKVKYYPPKSAWEYMVSSIQREGLKITFYDGADHVLQSMHLGGTTNDELGTYALLEGSSQPYVIHVPGFNGSLATRFKISNQDWRDRMIIDEPIADIEYIQVEYPQAPLDGFKIDHLQVNQFELYDLKQKQFPFSVPLILLYLSDLNQTGCEGIENDFINKSLVLASIPHAILKLKISGRPLRVINFYTTEAVGEESPDRMFVYDGRDFYLAQLRILQKIFRPIDYFRK